MATSLALVRAGGKCPLAFGLQICITHSPMAGKKKNVEPKKRRPGRPATGRDPIYALRAPPELMRRVDKLAEADPDKPNRSEMLRRLIELAAQIKERRK